MKSLLLFFCFSLMTLRTYAFPITPVLENGTASWELILDPNEEQRANYRVFVYLSNPSRKGNKKVSKLRVSAKGEIDLPLNTLQSNKIYQVSFFDNWTCQLYATDTFSVETLDKNRSVKRGKILRLIPRLEDEIPNFISKRDLRGCS